MTSLEALLVPTARAAGPATSPAARGIGDAFNGGAGTDKIQALGTGVVTLASFAKTNGIEQWAGNSKGVAGTSAANNFDFSALTSVSGWKTIDGKSGNDKIVGTKFADTLIGGTGKDLLTGGASNDTFDFNSVKETVKGSNRDQILDFSHSQGDKIDLSTIDATIRAAIRRSSSSARMPSPTITVSYVIRATFCKAT
jgi:serralysin